NMSPASSVKPDQIGKVPGALKQDNTWIGFPQWTQHRATLMHIQAWSQWPGVGVGLIARRVAGLDIDITDPELADALEQLTYKILGLTVCRFGNPPKRLLPYRTTEPLKKVRLRFAKEGESEQAIELLGHRQQFVLHHIHAKTLQPYEWPLGDLVDLGLEATPQHTPAQFAEYLEAAIKEAERLGWNLVERTNAREHERRDAVDVRLDLPM